MSLETRGGQKEVAIRKVNGAKVRDIILQFSRPYIKSLVWAFVINLVCGLVFIFLGIFQINWECVIFDVGIFLFISLVTFLTIWQKIYKVAKTNPAEIIQNS